MVRSLLFGLSVAAVVGCSGNTVPPTGGPDGKGPPAAKPVEFTLTAEELAKAYDADKGAYKTKYGGKRGEVTGEVMIVRVGPKGLEDVLLVGAAKAKDFFAQTVGFAPRAADRDKFGGLAGLARGQSVTVRGDVADLGVGLADCEVVKVGPSPALPVTPSGLKAALQTEEGKAKYDGKAVVLRGEVRKAEWNKTVATLTVADPGAKDGPTLEASVNPNAREVGEAIGQTKPGTVVILIGEADVLNEGWVWNIRVLSAPPEGVTLPGDKK